MTRRALSLSALVAASLAVAGCGSAGSSPGTSAPRSQSVSPQAAPAPVQKRLVARQAPAQLPVPVSGEAAAPTSGGVLVIGGVDSADASVSTISKITAGGRKVAPAGALATPLHDAGAATLSGATFVFGGGAATTIDSIESLSAAGRGHVVGTLPATRSDLSAVTVGTKAFVVGGFDGTTTVGSVLQTTNGTNPRPSATLLTPVRYPAVAAVGQTIYALGGELADGTDTDSIQAVDTRTGRVTMVGRLPKPLSHASAIELGSKVYLLGGRVGGVGGKAVDDIVSFDPATARVKHAGRLPMPVTNATATTSGGAGYLAGGLGSSGAPLRSVVTLRLEVTAAAG